MDDLPYLLVLFLTKPSGISISHGLEVSINRYPSSDNICLSLIN